MATQGTTTEVSLKEKAENLWNLGNATAMDYLSFLRYTERVANDTNTDWNKGWIEKAEEELAKIEDAIKRYREGRPQSYEEKPTD